MKSYNKLKEDIISCRDCRSILPDEPNPIFQGLKNSKIMQIGQAPSKTAMKEGKAFWDASGNKLIDEWYQIRKDEFYNEENFYIASMAKCFPGKAKGQGDRKPPKQCAKKFLERELTIIEPELYIVIGSYAAKWFFPNEKLTDLIYQDHMYRGKPLFVIPHPSPLNYRWFHKHPKFEQERLKIIRAKIQDIIKNR